MALTAAPKDGVCVCLFIYLFIDFLEKANFFLRTVAVALDDRKIELVCLS